MITLSGPSPNAPAATFGGGAQYGGATGRTANFGYTQAGSQPRSSIRGGLMTGDASAPAAPNLLPAGLLDQPQTQIQQKSVQSRRQNFTAGTGKLASNTGKDTEMAAELAA